MNMSKLLQHFKWMQDRAASFIEPGPYADLDGNSFDTDVGQRIAFAGDMIYMLDGPEQREAEGAPFEPGEGLDACWLLTQRLHRLFDTPAPYLPTMQTDDLVARRAAWIRSEVDELFEARTLVDQADAYLDVIVFAIGGLVELGIKPGALYEIVMASQFAKVWADGKPRVREDGKWLKPPNWVAPEPELAAEVARQVDEARPDEADAGDQLENLVPPA
jgi:hypothetical protein